MTDQNASDPVLVGFLPVSRVFRPFQLAPGPKSPRFMLQGSVCVTDPLRGRREAVSEKASRGRFLETEGRLEVGWEAG